MDREEARQLFQRFCRWGTGFTDRGSQWLTAKETLRTGDRVVFDEQCYQMALCPEGMRPGGIAAADVLACCSGEFWVMDYDPTNDRAFDRMRDSQGQFNNGETFITWTQATEMVSAGVRSEIKKMAAERHANADAAHKMTALDLVHEFTIPPGRRRFIP